MSKQIRNALIRARDLISNPERWTQGGFARDQVGTFTHPKDAEACCWCTLGAVYKTTTPENIRVATATSLEQVMGGAIGPFNDSATHEDVLAAFDIAICLES